MTALTNSFEAEHQLILLSAGTSFRRRAAREHMDRLMTAVDWSRLIEFLCNQRLLTTLGPRILEIADERASEEFKIGVATSLEAARRQDALLQLISIRVMEVLADAGIISTVLKGPSLGEALYGEPGRRLSSDIDLLVAPEQLNEAVEVVCKLEYARPIDHVGTHGLPLLHFALVHNRKELPPVELHWRIHWYESHFARDRLLAPSEGSSWRPAPVDELAALLLFYARDGFIGLRHATDLSAWWDNFGAQLRPGALDESIRSYPALGPVLSAALKVAEKTVGLPTKHIIRDEVALGTRSRIAVRLANTRPYSSEAQLYADIGLIDGLLTPLGGLPAFIRRQVAPPRDVIREHAEKAQSGGRVNSTIGYSVRALGRYVLAMSRLLRPSRAMRSRFVP